MISLNLFFFWLFGFQGLLWLHPNFRILLFYFYDKYCIFQKDCIESANCLGNMTIFTMLIFPIHEHKAFFHLFVSSSISFDNVLQCTGVFTHLVKFINRYFILLEVLMGIAFLIRLDL